jgi:uncharacterized protein (TIGR00730 family)
MVYMKHDLHETAERLAKIVHEGKHTMPEDHGPLVCKPREVEPWRIFKIMNEFVEGFDILRRHGLAASFFGSARTTPEDAMYTHAEDLARRLSKRGFSIITGGSSGIMQAANKGAFEAGGASVGLNVKLTDVQDYNPYLTERFVFDHFFVRKVMLTYASEAYIYFPGGFGTLDEFFEIVTLVQTKKLKKVPIILYGKEYWDTLKVFIDSTLFEKYKTIDDTDRAIYHIVDSVDEAYEYITNTVTC